MIPAFSKEGLLAAQSPTHASQILLAHVVRSFLLVLVSINGKGTFDFALDTGAMMTAVDQEFTRELALDTSGRGTAITLTAREAPSCERALL